MSDHHKADAPPAAPLTERELLESINFKLEVWFYVGLVHLGIAWVVAFIALLAYML